MRLALVTLALAIVLAANGAAAQVNPSTGNGASAQRGPVTIQKPLAISLPFQTEALRLLLTNKNGIEWKPEGFVDGNTPTQHVVSSIIVHYPEADPRYEVAMEEISEILLAVRENRYIPPSQRSSAQRPMLPANVNGNSSQYTGSNFQNPQTQDPSLLPSQSVVDNSKSSGAAPDPMTRWTNPGAGVAIGGTPNRTDSTLGTSFPAPSLFGRELGPVTSAQGDPSRASGMAAQGAGTGFSNNQNPGAFPAPGAGLANSNQNSMLGPFSGSSMADNRNGASGIQPMGSGDPRYLPLRNPLDFGNANSPRPSSGFGFPSSDPRLAPIASLPTADQRGQSLNGGNSNWQNPPGLITQAAENPLAQNVRELQDFVVRQSQELQDLKSDNLYLQRQQEDQRLAMLANRHAANPTNPTPLFDGSGIQTGGAGNSTGWANQGQMQPVSVETSQAAMQRQTPAPQLGLPANIEGKSSRTPGMENAVDANRLFLLWLFLAASIGLNVYLGIVAHGLYMRYGDLADELRETFTNTA